MADETTTTSTSSSTTTTTTRPYDPSKGIDMSQPPYFDRFDSDSNRTRLLFNPDKHLQAGELNELQSIQSYYLGQLGNLVAKDGDMQEGMSFSQEGNEITVEDGKVYLAGKVRNFAKQTVTITGKGMEYVGVKLVQKIITADDDDTLYDQVIGLPASETDGASRLEETVLLVANDTTAATIYQYNSGVLYKRLVANELSKITDIMAKRSYDTNGNYRVGSKTGKETGFDMSITKNDEDPDNKVNLIIQPGTAFVQGYEIEKPYPTTLVLDKALDTETITGEQYIYKPAISEYPLRNANVKAVTSVTGQVQRILTVNHTSQDGTDQVVENMISVDKVYTTGANPHTYVEGEDYIVTGNGISWEPATGQEPKVNTTYLVQASFNQKLTGNGVDYTVVSSSDGLSTSISFANAKGSNGVGAYIPKENGFITVTYDCYLYRVDLVTLDKDGTFMVHKGQPARKEVAMAPSLYDPLTLTIGTIIIYPNADSGETDSKPVTNLTMEKLQKLVDRVSNLEYNQVVNSLDNQTIQEHTPEVLRGVFTDMFVTMDKYDSSYNNKSNNVEGFESNVMFSFDDGRITLPRNAEDPYQAQIIGDSSTAHVWGRLVSAPFDEVPVVQQLQATGFENINEYNFFQKEGILLIDPSADNWIDTKNVTIYQTKTHTYNTGRWWRHPGNVSGSAENDWYNKNTDWSQNGALVWQTTLKGTITETGQTTTDEQIQYMRKQTITFTATGLSPQDDDLVMRFNGIRVPITPASGYNKGSKESGSIMADSAGTAAGTFDVPEGVKCGKVPVVLQGKKSAASSTYVAQGINRTVTDTIIRTYVTAHLTDPLAQSFQTLDARVITGINLYFGSKSTSSSVTVEIRGMSNTGFPNTTVYATAVLTPDMINVSNDASAVTKVRFDDPLMTNPGQSFAIVILSDSNDYTVATAQMGHTLLGEQQEVLQGQAYLEGVMFKSSNASTWSPSQMTDLKFEVIGAQFNKSATMLFDPFVNMKLDQFVLFATYLTPDNTGCTWEYRLFMQGDTGTIDGKPWLPLANLDLTDAYGTAAQAQLRATFTANQYISPLMSLDDLQFGAFTTALRGDYVGITMDCSDAAFNTITVTYNENIPGKSSVVPQFSIDGGRSWNDFKSNPTTKTVATGWQQVRYVEQITAETTNKLEASSDPNVTTPDDKGTTTGLVLAKSFKIHFKLATPNPYQRPSVKQLAIAVTNE